MIIPARELCGKHVGMSVEVIFHNTGKAPTYVIDRGYVEITMITHKKNGRVLVRCNDLREDGSVGAQPQYDMRGDQMIEITKD